MTLQTKGWFKKKTMTAFGALLVLSSLSVIGASASDNVIPIMTSNTNVLGTASASSEWASHEAYKAFDHDTGTYWSTSSGSTGELRFTFASPKTVRSYTLRTSSEPLANVPKTWTFQASNDGSTWTVLDSESAYYYPNSTLSFSLSNSTSYNRYRIVITANNGAYSTSVAEVGMYE